MQITETGYYETRDSGLAYVAGILPKKMGIYSAVGVLEWDGSWVESETWMLDGSTFEKESRDNDLIRYIGKELPEDNPNPERVELSKLWIVWGECHRPNQVKFIEKGTAFYNSLEAAKEHMRHFPYTETFTVLAITPADATGFFIGEGLND